MTLEAFKAFKAKYKSNTERWYHVLQWAHDEGKISTRTLLEEMNIDYDAEVRRMAEEIKSRLKPKKEVF